MQRNLIKNIILKTIIRIFILILSSLQVSAQIPKYEVRAVWLTTIGGIDWPHTYASSTHSIARQKQELITILDQLQQANINTILLQTRIRATTIFPSGMEPWDGCLSGHPGTSPGYDALQFAVEECHRRGMTCHAWIVTIPVGKWDGYGCRQLRSKYPRLVRCIGEEGYMDPEQELTGDYLARFCAEVTRRYDVDGIHLDYIRYPETWKLKVSRREGRQFITNIVGKIHRAVKAQKPWVMLSCSPIGKYDDLSRFNSSGWNANTTVCQDAQAWLRDGLMDALFPMMYFQGNHFYPFMVNWKEFSYGRIVVPGLAVYMLHPKERNWPLDVVQREMNVLREQALGYTFFRSKFLTDNTKGVYEFTKDFNRYPALIPPMTWESRRVPSPVGGLTLSRGMTIDQLSWQGMHSGDNQNILYNVYASEDYPVDVNDARNLIACRQQGTATRINHQGKTYNYAVTAVDRYGNESVPRMTANKNVKPRKRLDFRSLIMGNRSK